MDETFGQRLARLRKRKGLTQEEIAEKIGISPQAVSKWENDISSPDISIIISLSDILGVTTDELLGKEVINPEVAEDNGDRSDPGIHIKGAHIHLKDDEGSEVHISTDGISIHAESGEINLNVDGQEKQKSRSKFINLIDAMEGGLFLLALVAYIIMGIFWNDQFMGWKMGWLAFFIPLIITSSIDAIITRKIHRFAYPILVTFTYLLLGFLGSYFGFNGWGVYWFLFITIPAFYAIVSPIDHYLGKK